MIIPNTITRIGDYAFYTCYSLKSVTIGNSVTSIGIGAFRICTELTTINIGSGLTDISALSLISDYNQKLTNINVDAANPRYTSIDGVVFSKAKDTLLKYTLGRAWTYTIPNSVTSIGSGAFNACTGLTSITIPNSVTSIGSGAFNACTGLTSITIPNSVTSIGSGAFESCSSLSSVTMQSSVTSIGGRAFSGCTGLTSITIGNGVTNIGDNAFYGCNKIETLYWDADISIMYKNDPYSPYETAKNYFQDSKSSLKNIFFGYHATKVNSSGFDGFTNVENLNLENKDIYFSSSNLKTITLGRYFNDYLSSNYTNLITINVDANNLRYTSIDGVLFSKAKDTIFAYPADRIGTYTIPNSVTSIGNNAFYGCRNLTTINIGSGLTSLYELPLGASNLTTLNVDANNPRYASINGILFSKAKDTLVRYPRGKTGTSYTIPNSVTSIEGGAFSSCSGLTSITIGNSVKSIEGSAFYNCSGLTSITIPNSVTSIGGRAFWDCSGLTSVTMQGTTPPILDNYVFYGTPSTLKIYVPSGYV